MPQQLTPFNHAPRNAIAENVARNVTMSSLELLELVNQSRIEFKESEVRHNDFVARCRDELDGEFYETFVIKPEGRGRPSEALRMTADQCKLVAMRESKGVRRRVLSRLSELESRQPFALPTDYITALEHLLEAKRAEQAANQALAVAAPKAEFVDRYVDSTGLKGFRQVAKLLNANEARFREFLIDRKIMYRLGGEWMAYQNHIDAGRFDVKTGASDSGHAFNQTKFTPKGVNWIAGLWAQAQLKDAVA